MSEKTIAIATHKGGVAKTVTAMAVAAALARAGRKALLVDLDPQGHSTLGLGVEVGDTDLTLRDVFSDPPAPITKVIKPTHIPRLHILPSNIRLERIAHSLYMRPKREEILRRALQPIQSDYTFIIIDCPPSLGVLTETGLAAADFVVVPCQMEARAADGLIDLLDVLGVLKGESFSHWGILLTKYDHRKSVTNEAVMISLAPWADKIFKTNIPQSEPLNQAQIQRTDIFTFDPKSKGALAYEAFTQELLEYAYQ